MTYFETCEHSGCLLPNRHEGRHLAIDPYHSFPDPGTIESVRRVNAGTGTFICIMWGEQDRDAAPNPPRKWFAVVPTCKEVLVNALHNEPNALRILQDDAEHIIRLRRKENL